jgi:hypothetical protein
VEGRLVDEEEDEEPEPVALLLLPDEDGDVVLDEQVTDEAVVEELELRLPTPLVDELDDDVVVLFGSQNSMVWLIVGFRIVPLSVTVGELNGIVTSQTFP